MAVTITPAYFARDDDYFASDNVFESCWKSKFIILSLRFKIFLHNIVRRRILAIRPKSIFFEVNQYTAIWFGKSLFCALLAEENCNSLGNLPFLVATILSLITLPMAKISVNGLFSKMAASCHFWYKHCTVDIIFWSCKDASRIFWRIQRHYNHFYAFIPTELMIPKNWYII